MTALREYQRLEATALWRPGPDEQRREVIVSVGDATLTISDLQDRPLAHWSLAALARQNPGERPAIFSPDGDPGETLELSEREDEMIAAIEKLRRAVERARPHPGRLRFLGAGLSMAVVVGVLFFWLPGAMITYSVSVVPHIQREDIGEALLARIETLVGTACQASNADAARVAMARRTDVPRVEVVPGGISDTLHLPGGIYVLNKTLIEDFEDPAVPAGFIIAEKARAVASDPLADLLKFGGAVSAFRLITTGTVTDGLLDQYAEHLATQAADEPAPDALLSAFSAANISSRPYAFAKDVTGETTLALIEADPMANTTQTPILRDSVWLQLQTICGG